MGHHQPLAIASQLLEVTQKYRQSLSGLFGESGVFGSSRDTRVALVDPLVGIANPPVCLCELLENVCHVSTDCRLRPAEATGPSAIDLASHRTAIERRPSMRTSAGTPFLSISAIPRCSDNKQRRCPRGYSPASRLSRRRPPAANYPVARLIERYGSDASPVDWKDQIGRLPVAGASPRGGPWTSAARTFRICSGYRFRAADHTNRAGKCLSTATSASFD